jgi:glycosyltransferase involved in cell wall biosynthesis
MIYNAKRVPQVSLVIPARNEAATICQCIQKAQNVFADMGLEGEILVADSSTDGTDSLAASCGARVVKPKELGYGNAIRAGLEQAQGDYIVVMDGDMTYDPEAIKEMIPLLQSGNFDMVTGSRLRGKISPGAMPRLHRYIGNPFLTWLLNTLFSAGISDGHCGERAITRSGLQKLNLRAGGMEFATEMLIEATAKNLRIAEVPISYYPRRGSSKLASFSDGWRHLRFMMLYKPVPFLLMPGLLALVSGLALSVDVYLQGGTRMHSMILGGLLAIIGYQMLLGGIYFGAFGSYLGVSSSKIIKKFMSYHSLEKELLLGIVLLGAGILLGLNVLLSWRAAGFGALDAAQSAIISLILCILGIQTIFSGIFISLLLISGDQPNGQA